MTNYKAGIDVRRTIEKMKKYLNEAEEIPQPEQQTIEGQLNVEEEIENFKNYFKDKGISAGFMFGQPQPLKIYQDGILWSGKINDVIQWYFNSYVNQNERSCEIAVDNSVRLELNQESIEILNTLYSYFDIVTDKWIETYFSGSSEQ